MNVQVKVFARSTDIGLDVYAVPGWTRAPPARRQHVLIPAKDLGWKDVLDDELILDMSGTIARRAHQVRTAVFRVFAPASRLKESRARIGEVRLRMRQEVRVANGPRALDIARTGQLQCGEGGDED